MKNNSPQSELQPYVKRAAEVLAKLAKAARKKSALHLKAPAEEAKKFLREREAAGQLNQEFQKRLAAFKKWGDKFKQR